MERRKAGINDLLMFAAMLPSSLAAKNISISPLGDKSLGKNPQTIEQCGGIVPAYEEKTCYYVNVDHNNTGVFTVMLRFPDQLNGGEFCEELNMGDELLRCEQELRRIFKPEDGTLNFRVNEGEVEFAGNDYEPVKVKEAVENSLISADLAEKNETVISTDGKEENSRGGGSLLKVCGSAVLMTAAAGWLILKSKLKNAKPKEDYYRDKLEQHQISPSRRNSDKEFPESEGSREMRRIIESGENLQIQERYRMKKAQEAAQRQKSERFEAYLKGERESMEKAGLSKDFIDENISILRENQETHKFFK